MFIHFLEHRERRVINCESFQSLENTRLQLTPLKHKPTPQAFVQTSKKERFLFLPCLRYELAQESGDLNSSLKSSRLTNKQAFLGPRFVALPLKNKDNHMCLIG